MSAFHAH